MILKYVELSGIFSTSAYQITQHIDIYVESNLYIAKKLKKLPLIMLLWH
jgi:hypothetical protein